MFGGRFVCCLPLFLFFGVLGRRGNDFGSMTGGGGRGGRDPRASYHEEVPSLALLDSLALKHCTTAV